MRKETLEITYDMAKEIISRDLETMSQKFISIGYHLKLIRDKCLYIQDGYKDIWEFAQSAYGISKSTCSRWISMNDKFSEGGNSPELKEEFRKFGKSQLQEMLYLTDEQIEQAKPEMTAKEIREIRKPEKRTPDPEEIQGQMQIEDYPELLPEKTLKKPNEQERKYLKCLAKHLIKSMHSWFLEDFTNRVTRVDKSPKEIKEVLGKSHRTRYFSMGKGAAHANLFDDYVQIWNESGNYMGDYEWFYLAAAIQSTWSEVVLENARETAIEPERKEVQQEAQEERQDGLVAPAQQETKVQQEDAEEEIEENPQTPLPKMKNNDQRKEWLKNYRDWGIWYKDEHIGATYYRYEFDNGAALIVEEYEKVSEYTGKYISSYHHLVGGPKPERKNGIPKWTYNETYNRYQNSESELVEFLKEIQRHG